MQVVYRGPFADVNVPSLGVVGVVRDVPVEVDDKAGRALVKLPGWHEMKAEPPKATAKAKGDK